MEVFRAWLNSMRCVLRSSCGLSEVRDYGNITDQARNDKDPRLFHNFATTSMHLAIALASG